MRVATMISLGASALLGVGALVVAKVWLPSSSGGAPNAGAARAAPEVPVVVAATALPYGVKLERKHLALAKMPANAAPEGAYSSIEALLTADAAAGAPVVLIPMSIREPILPPKVSGPGSRKSVAAQIAAGMRAYTIRVTDVAGVGGHALPGDRVDVLLTRDLSADQNVQRFASDVVIQNVRLLGMDLNADPTSTESKVPQTATLEVSVEDAQKLAIAADLGALSLALRRAGASELAPIRRVAANDLGAGFPLPAGVVMRASASTAAPSTAMA
ncbi:MAG TPA: Flp pilus assembly protein CpaB, partial [Caulobacteraceae bacterium]